MKIRSLTSQHGSVLITALMTITIMTMICATSLYISSQNSGSGMQTAGWQQSLTAAEAGIDAGIRALNAAASSSPSPWQGWKKVSYSSPAANYTLPATEPTATATPTANPSGSPDSTHYYYLPSSTMTLSAPNTEGASSTSAWVTVDNIGGSSGPLYNSSSGQWYRIRSTGQTIYPSGSMLLKRVSNNRLDNDLRNTIAMNFNKKTNTTNVYTGGSNGGPTRTIEVVVSPQTGSTTTSPWGGKGVFLQNALTMSGGGSMGHFSSNTVTMSNFQASPALYRSTDYTETLIGMNNANGTNLNNTYVYGGVSYSTSSAAPKNTGNVQGSITTPFSQTAPAVSDPTWTPDVTYTGGGSLPFTTIGPASNNNQNNPYKVKVNGNFTVPGGKSLTITSPNSGGSTTYIEFWITGSFTTSGSGFINQANGVHVTYYVDGSVTTSGQSLQNNGGFAGNTQFMVVGGGDVTISGSGNFIGTVEAPNSLITVSGSALMIGALIGNTMNISGGASYYYDDALTGWTGGTGNTTGAGGTANYAFASWFEDNADPSKSSLDTNYAPHPIVY